jgi:hypothetical protein
LSGPFLVIGIGGIGIGVAFGGAWVSFLGWDGVIGLGWFFCWLPFGRGLRLVGWVTADLTAFCQPYVGIDLQKGTGRLYGKTLIGEYFYLRHE